MAQEEYVTRSEYEQFTRMYELRHSELRLEIKDLESGLKTDISNMTVKIDALKTQLDRKGADGWKLAATSTISLIVGYVLYFAQHLLTTAPGH